MEMELKGQKVNGGYAEGEAVVFHSAFSFLGDLDPESGLFMVPGHQLYRQNLAGKVLIFTTGHGSTYGPYSAYSTKKLGNAPAAMICIEVEPVLALAAITADIPMVHRLEKNPIDVIETGDYVKVDATKGIVKVKKGHL